MEEDIYITDNKHKISTHIYKEGSIRKSQIIQEKKVNKGDEHTFIKENCNDQWTQDDLLHL